MSAQVSVASNGEAHPVAQRLHATVLEELQQRGLDNAEALAGELGVVSLAAAELLRSSQWTVDTSIWLIDQLQLPIDINVTRR